MRKLSRSVERSLIQRQTRSVSSQAHLTVTINHAANGEPNQAEVVTFERRNRENKEMKTPYVSILAEIPEELHESLTGYLEAHPDWDRDRLVAAALSLFLLQNSNSGTAQASLCYHNAARVYLEMLFEHQT